MDIGGKLREVRESHSLSQRDMAARAGMTGGAISLIEQNKSSPSVSSLKALLDVIPMSLSEFFAAVERSDQPQFFFATHEFVKVTPVSAGLGENAALLSLRQLGQTSRHKLRMVHKTFPPGADTGPGMLSHGGEAAGIIMSGAIEITVDDQTRVLHHGEGYNFDSMLPHRYRNRGTVPCVIVSMCKPPPS